MIHTKAYAALKSKAPLVPFTFDRREPKDTDVVFDVKFCGICHSDIHQVRDEWGGAEFPMVPGHEIAGVVTRVGAKVTKYKVGDHVGVGCMVDSCRTCAHCEKDLEQYCLEGATMSYGSTERDGRGTTQGGYADTMICHEDFVLRIPRSIPLDKAAPLLCAGITLYSPLKHWQAGPGKKVAILGLGGLGHMGVKIARALGADVTVLSHSEKKRGDAESLGAHHFVCTKDEGVFKKMAGTFDLIINTVSAEINMGDYFNLLKLDGALVAVGLPDRPLSVHPFPLVSMRRSYAGSLIGGIRETQEMLDFCAQHGITPEIEVVTPDKINEAIERVIKSDVRYRFVIDTGKL